MHNAHLLAALNADLNREYQMIVCYLYHLYSPAAPTCAATRDALRARIASETSHADRLARVITALGGTPAVERPDLPVALDSGNLLAVELTLERQMIAAYEQRCRDTADDPALHAVLASLLAEERAHAAEIEVALAAHEGHATIPPAEPPPLTAVA